MSILLTLTKKQNKVLKPILEDSSVEADWLPHGIELTTDNYVNVLDAIQKAIFNDVLEPTHDDNREHLQHIFMRALLHQRHFTIEELTEAVNVYEGLEDETLLDDHELADLLTDNDNNELEEEKYNNENEAPQNRTKGRKRSS